MIDSVIKLLLFQATGEAFVDLLSIPIPGPVAGMLLLFLYLVARGEDEKLTAFSTGFLRHLALLFIPAAVGIMLHLERVTQEWLPILVSLLASMLAAIPVTAIVVRLFKRGD